MFLPVRVLVTGGRDYADKEYLFDVLDRWHAERGIECIIEGGATGADALAGMWANERGVMLHVFPAQWELGTSAGMLRNTQMLVEGKPNVVIAFPGDSGTENMMGIAQKQGVPVIRPHRDWQVRESGSQALS